MRMACTRRRRAILDPLKAGIAGDAVTTRQRFCYAEQSPTRRSREVSLDPAPADVRQG